jgi:cell wall-associated NlpC family hydrolase
LSKLKFLSVSATLKLMPTRRALSLAPLAVLSGLWSCATPPGAPAPRTTALDRRATAEVAPHPQVAGLLVSAIGLVGVPYRLGGNTMENGFDCSGFTRHLFQTHLGVTLPRRSQDQADAPNFVDVPGFELQPGDLVFFNTLQRANSHVGIYIGDGRFIHAPRTGAVVRLEPLRSSYWLQRYDGARRLVVTNPPTVPGG